LVIIYFGHFLKITKAARILGATFSGVKVWNLILTIMVWAAFLEIFFTNSSGHPGGR
jgi:hypothetical protein